MTLPKSMTDKLDRIKKKKAIPMDDVDIEDELDIETEPAATTPKKSKNLEKEPKESQKNLGKQEREEIMEEVANLRDAGVYRLEDLNQSYQANAILSQHNELLNRLAEASERRNELLMELIEAFKDE